MSNQILWSYVRFNTSVSQWLALILRGTLSYLVFYHLCFSNLYVDRWERSLVQYIPLWRNPPPLWNVSLRTWSVNSSNLRCSVCVACVRVSSAFLFWWILMERCAATIDFSAFDTLPSVFPRFFLVLSRPFIFYLPAPSFIPSRHRGPSSCSYPSRGAAHASGLWSDRTLYNKK